MTQVTTFSELGIKASESKAFIGDKISIDTVLNIPIIVHGFEVKPSTTQGKYDKCLYLQIEHKGEMRVIFIGSRNLVEMIEKVPANKFPFETRIMKANKFASYEFR